MENVSVLIIARNEESNLTRLFESIGRLSYPKESLEVVLVDDGSSDKTGDIAKSFGAKIVRNEKSIGRGRARNVALENASYDYVAWIDADCEILDNDWVQNMMKHLIGDVVGVAGTHKRPSDGNIWQRAVWHVPGMHIETDKVIDYERAPTTSSLFLKKALLEVGGYDENFTTGEDLEICWRLRDKGYKFKLIPDASIVHHYRTDPIKFFKQQFEYGREGAKIKRKYSPLLPPILSLLAVLAVGLGMWFYPFITFTTVILILTNVHLAIDGFGLIPVLGGKVLLKEKDLILAVVFGSLEQIRNVAVVLGFLVGSVVGMKK